MSDKPNVLLICCDHWPAHLLGVAGHPVIQTPTLDQIARNGIRFTNAYSECPVCIPARRTLMTGTSPKAHGDRVYKDRLEMPDFTTLAQTFRNAGYQAYASGKLHVYPQRDRIGFDDVMLGEEGRTQFGVTDDYEMFLAEQGYPGQQFEHGMCNNEYLNRPWHLPEPCHVTNWTTREMVRFIQRRDPTRPGFWYLSYCHPHPPLAPLQHYVDLYREIGVDEPYRGDWAGPDEELPYALGSNRLESHPTTPAAIRTARQAFYALCTQIDHQLRRVIGTLREEGLLDNTIICFTSDHGDMLGDHGLWAKRIFLEQSANVPLLLVGAAKDERVPHHRVDDRLVGWQDIMPTLLELAGVPIPDSVEGRSMVTGEKRDYLYGECSEGARANRMIHDGRYKLIYYPTGNRFQLFDLEEDPRELHNLAGRTEVAEVEQRLAELLRSELYGGDEAWYQDGAWVGLPAQSSHASPNRALGGQRGSHWPLPG